MRPVILLIGPTASGKTALACALADRFPLDIVSVDSALVYRDMNIGTAKPDAATLSRYPHRLIDLISPEDAYSAAEFRRDALTAIADSHARGRVPLLVGGTMMYVKALVDGLSALPAADPAIRAELEARAAQEGWPALHAELARIDVATAARLAPNDSQRIQRALEVYRVTGERLSSLQQRPMQARRDAFPYRTRMLSLMPSDRVVLHERIAARFDAMLAAGFIDEVAALRKRYRLDVERPAMRCVGYRQVWMHLDGRLTHAAMRDAGIAATRQLAKRQMTWMRAMNTLERLDCLSPALAEDAISRVAVFLSLAG